MGTGIRRWRRCRRCKAHRRETILPLGKPRDTTMYRDRITYVAIFGGCGMLWALDYWSNHRQCALVGALAGGFVASLILLALIPIALALDRLRTALPRGNAIAWAIAIPALFGNIWLATDLATRTSSRLGCW